MSAFKGGTLIDFVKRNYKDIWFTVGEIRSVCPRGGSYAREVFERAAREGLIERKVKKVPLVYYRIDPPAESSGADIERAKSIMNFWGRRMELHRSFLENLR